MTPEHAHQIELLTRGLAHAERYHASATKPEVRQIWASNVELLARLLARLKEQA